MRKKVALILAETPLMSNRAASAELMGSCCGFALPSINRLVMAANGRMMGILCLAGAMMSG